MEPKLRFRQFFPFRNQYDGAEGGLELLHHIDNKQLIYSTSGLKAQMPKCPTIPIPLYVYCSANVQKRKPRQSAFPQSCQQQFDIRTSIGQGHRSRMQGMVSMLRSRFPDLVVDLLPSKSWLDRLALVLNARYISDCLARFGIAPGGGLRGRFRKVCRTSPQTLGILVPKSRANACRVHSNASIAQTSRAYPAPATK
jgi:hypothetical protein